MSMNFTVSVLQEGIVTNPEGKTNFGVHCVAMLSNTVKIIDEFNLKNFLRRVIF